MQSQNDGSAHYRGLLAAIVFLVAVGVAGAVAIVVWGDKDQAVLQVTAVLGFVSVTIAVLSNMIRNETAFAQQNEMAIRQEIDSRKLDVAAGEMHSVKTDLKAADEKKMVVMTAIAQGVDETKVAIDGEKTAAMAKLASALRKVSDGEPTPANLAVADAAEKDLADQQARQPEKPGDWSANKGNGPT